MTTDDPQKVPEWQSGYYRDDPYSKGLARVAWAAREMGVSFDQLFQAARDMGISTAGGIDWEELIPLARKMLIREKDPARRARIGSAVVTFTKARREDRAA